MKRRGATHRFTTAAGFIRSNSWGWIPGPIAVRPVYAPALVAFIGGPRFSLSVSIGGGGGGNVGWFPLGPREVYVPDLSAQAVRMWIESMSATQR